MEIARLRHFLAVVDAMHFGRAADVLGIAQPALSRSIKLLENEIGVQLFDRSLRQIQLTEAGRLLAREAAEIVSREKLAKKLARAAAGEAAKELRVGFISSAAFGFLADCIRVFRQRHPETKLQLFELMPSEQLKMLASGDLDVCYMSLPMEGTESFNTLSVLRSSSVYAAMPAAWELARRPSIKMVDLARQPFVLSDPNFSRTWRNLVNTACNAAGFSPNIVQESKETLVVLMLVASGLGVSIMHDEVRRLNLDGVKFVRIDDAPDYITTDLSLVWVPEAMNGTLRDFIDVVHAEGTKRQKINALSADRAPARQ
jgi:DNA-binding transcriptional LysR family regulator